MIKILFVCHGNICRSAAAKYVMQKLVNEAGLSAQFFIDSAATSAEELGNPVYPPMARTLRAHGVPCEGHVARQMRKRDYADFDMLIGMDSENLYYMNRMYGKSGQDGGRDSFWAHRNEAIAPDDPEGKIALLMHFADAPRRRGETGGPADRADSAGERIREVADPWYTRDFEATYRDVLEGCQGLLEACREGGRPERER